ncbi:hypothetical protein DFH07DRAFT_732130 [Mycena maculata]|uniref:Terpenoid synthase n=1 Tax=Mycena maculata TaxID=230809 RepID=A0AAD7K2S1_9AGAR|nr:hypothetical protein DFH07DRAFT_732130 [Mycena maculata]
MSPEYTACIRRLLAEIGYREEPLPSYNVNFWGPFHVWVFDTLGPSVPLWGVKQLAEVEHAAGGISERAYPYAELQLKLIIAKLTAIGIVLDDSIENETLYTEIVQFSHRLCLGEVQPNGILALFRSMLNELSDFYGNDAVLRSLAIFPWMSFLDACLLEREIFTVEVCFEFCAYCNALNMNAQRELKNSQHIRQHCLSTDGPGFSRACTRIVRKAFSFPRVVKLTSADSPQYLRSKSGAPEAYAAWIIKGRKEQDVPLSKYFRALPDLKFYVNFMNDVLSFHKEEIDGETHNFIHLRTRALLASGERGGGINGAWTPYDTLNLLCEEIIAATRRIDKLLSLEECEAKMRGETVGSEVDEVDIELAKQWRGWRDGYISWHFECRRYRLGPIKAAVF